jgi:hypothetical protein
MTQLDELSRQQCLEILERHSVGRIALCTTMGPRIVPVNYTLHDGGIVFRTTPYSELGTYGRDHEVAFEVDEIDADQCLGCSTVVRGHAEMVEEYDEVRDIRDHDDPAVWAEGRRDMYMRLPLRDVSGRKVCR